MTPEQIFAKYMAMSPQEKKDFKIIVDMVINWESVERHIYEDTYLAGLKNNVRDTMFRVKQIV